MSDLSNPAEPFGSSSGPSEPHSTGASRASPEARAACSKIITALAAIVNVRTPDKLYDLDAIPRDPVMDEVVRIRDSAYTLLKLLTVKD